MWETQVRSLGWEDPLEKGMETAPLIFLPGESHGRRSLGGLQSMGLQTVGHNRATTLSLSLRFHSEVTSCQRGFSLHILVSRSVPACSEPVGSQWLSSQKTPES